LVVALYFALTAPQPDPTPAPPTSAQVASPPTLTPAPADAQPTPASLLRDIPEGTRLLIPSAGVLADIVRVYVVDGSWNVSQLGENVGHLQGTSWVSEGGNTVLSGHVEMADGRLGVFARLKQVNVGDFVQVQTPNGAFLYNVVSVRATTPNDLTPVYPTVKPTLTLITCGSYDFLSDAYLERFIVVAELVQ
jgi:LPXTG-site transpeptidase (sortase) family protein